MSMLPSWRPGPTRDALLAFLEAASDVPAAARVAYFDNDGTLWCERPTYVQYDFFVDELSRRAAADPALADRPEFAAVLAGDPARIAELGLPRIAVALADLFAGLTPEEFTARVRAFAGHTRHPVLGHDLRQMRYLPMLELIDELRRREFTVGIVTGGGADFLRAISADLYGVPPELVVGTLIEHELDRTDAGAPELRRTSQLVGGANEGPAKVTNIQTQLGRRPLLAAGNSAGDADMLDWALAGPGPGLALLVDHDDPVREFAYASESATLAEAESITAVAARRGWTVASMAADWESVFAAD
jgi:hypothetical protein